MYNSENFGTVSIRLGDTVERPAAHSRPALGWTMIPLRLEGVTRLINGQSVTHSTGCFRRATNCAFKGVGGYIITILTHQKRLHWAMTLSSGVSTVPPIVLSRVSMDTTTMTRIQHALASVGQLSSASVRLAWRTFELGPGEREFAVSRDGI